MISTGMRRLSRASAYILGDGSETFGPTPPRGPATIETIRQMGCQILLVDDNDGFRTIANLKLTSTFKAKVTECKGVNSALRAIKGNPSSFFLILLDIELDGPMNGIKTYKKLRHDGVRSHVILMSAYDSDEIREEAKDLGLNLLAKPLDYGLLERLLLGFLRGDAS